MALLVLTTPLAAIWQAWTIAGGKPNSPLYYVVAFGVVAIWNGFWFCLIGRKLEIGAIDQRLDTTEPK
jgi:hypothetical protein